MKEMPKSLKNEIRKLQKAYEKAKYLELKVNTDIESYGVDPEFLNAIKIDDRNTEALAFVTNAEGDIEDNISEIEEVFLYHVNKNR